MKTYTFFYFDSLEDTKKGIFKEYSIHSPRFDSAFRSFSQFLSFNVADYIDISYNYNVFNGFKTQSRSLSYNDIIYLVHIKDVHNAEYWKTKYD